MLINLSMLAAKITLLLKPELTTCKVNLLCLWRLKEIQQISSIVTKTVSNLIKCCKGLETACKGSSVYSNYTLQTQHGHYLLMTKHFKVLSTRLVLTAGYEKKCLNLCFYCLAFNTLVFISCIYLKQNADNNRSSPGWIKKHAQYVTWRWKSGWVTRKIMERKQRGSHWSVLLTRLFLSCCIVWQQRNHTRQGEGGAETTQRDYCSSDQNRDESKQKGSQVTKVISY